jgi:hypothetical protein
MKKLMFVAVCLLTLVSIFFFTRNETEAYGNCYGDCSVEQGMCIGQCNGNSRCIANCMDAYGRCVSRCE